MDTDRTLINAARVLGASDRTIFVRVVVPASTPFILVGMRIGLGFAWARSSQRSSSPRRRGWGSGCSRPSSTTTCPPSRRRSTSLFRAPMFGGPTANTMWVRLTHHRDAANNETEVRAATSRDAVNWVWMGVWTLPTKGNPHIGLVSMNRAGATATFDHVRVYRGRGL